MSIRGFGWFWRNADLRGGKGHNQSSITKDSTCPSRKEKCKNTFSIKIKMQIARQQIAVNRVLLKMMMMIITGGETGQFWSSWGDFEVIGSADKCFPSTANCAT